MAKRKKTTRNKRYLVHMRTDPSGPYARVIRPFEIECPKAKLYENIAALEAWFMMNDDSAKHYAVHIHQGEGYGSSDERSSLAPEERKKIGLCISEKMKLPEKKLDGLVKSLFNMHGQRKYIG